MRLNGINLLVAKVAARKKDSAPILKTVHITSDFTEAFDGIRLARITMPVQQDLEKQEAVNGNLDCIISAEALNTAPAVESIIVAEQPETISLDCGIAVIIAKKEEGIFPNTDSLLEQLEEAAIEYTIMINPKGLAGICRIAQALGPEMIMQFRGQDKTVMIRAGTEAQELIALIQPYRGPDAAPDYFSRSSAPATPMPPMDRSKPKHAYKIKKKRQS